MNNRQKILNLIRTGNKTNIELAFMLDEQQGLGIKEEYIHYFGQIMHYSELFHNDLVNYTAHFVNTCSINLCEIELETIPSIVYAFSKVEVLNLNANNIKQIPEEIQALEELEYLQLSGNPIEKLPECFKSMESLSQVDLDQNHKVPQKYIDEVNYLKGKEVIKVYNFEEYKLF